MLATACTYDYAERMNPWKILESTVILCPGSWIWLDLARSWICFSVLYSSHSLSI